MTENEKQQLVIAVITQLKSEGTDVSNAKIVSNAVGIDYVVAYGKNGQIVRAVPTAISSEKVGATGYMNAYTEAGVYNINTSGGEDLPIDNQGAISARLTVLVSESDGNKVITQVLNLNNNAGGEGNVYIRSCQNGEWKAWGKLQTNIEVGQVNTLDNLIDNGIYSGVFTDGTPTSVGTFYDTFVLIVINNYAVSIPTGYPQSISQLKYSLGLDGSISVASRKRDQYGYWDNWASLDEKSLVEEEKTRAEQAEETIKNKAVDADSLNFQTRANVVALDYKTIDGVGDEITIPAATTKLAGVMSADDKQKLDTLVINDLTTGGADKALSAEMGKELGKQYDININGYYIERGTINSATGEEEDNRFRLRTNFVRSPFNINMADGYQLANVLEYSVNQEFIRKHVITDYTSYRINEKTPYLYRITFRQDDGGEIFVEENIFADNTEFNGVLTSIERLQDAVSKNEEELKSYAPIKQVVEDNFNVEKVVGDSPSITSLSVLEYLSDGEIGFPMQDVTYESNTLLTVYLNERTSKQYSICAAVLKGSSMPDRFAPDKYNSMQISLEYNFNTNHSYANTIARGLIHLDGSRYLAYNVSGIIDSKSSLPTTAYIRIPKSYTYNIAVDKVLLLDMDHWDESVLDIIASNVDSAWAGTTVFTKSELSKPATSLDRRLFEGIVFWGSSTTEGRWVQQVAANLKMPYYWGGVGSEKIWGIMGRMGVLPLRIKTPFTIPASSQVPVNLPDNYNFYVKWKGAYKGASIWGSKTAPSYKLLVNPCYIAGVKGNLIGGGANSDIPLQFQRLEDGNAVTTKAYEPVFTYGFRETRDCVQFLACHFNGGESSTEELVELYKKMYEVSCNKKVLIFGRHKSANGVVTSPTLETLQEQEIALEDEFGLMFFNTREYMCGRGFERFKELYPTYYTSADIEQASQGITPDCMYVNASNVHFNDRAYTVLTEAVTDRLTSLGYDKFRYGGDSPHPSYE